MYNNAVQGYGQPQASGKKRRKKREIELNPRKLRKPRKRRAQRWEMVKYMENAVRVESYVSELVEDCFDQKLFILQET